MTDVGAKHDVIFVLQDGSGEAGPDHQPAEQNESTK